MICATVRTFLVAALFGAVCVAGSAGAAVIDLTAADVLLTHTAASGGTILSYHGNGKTANGIGSSIAFLELRQSGGSGSQQGYNTDATLQFGTTRSADSLLLSDVPLVTIGGVNYYEFALGLSARGNVSQHSLDEFQVFQGDTANLDNYVDTGPTLDGLSPVFDWFGNNTRTMYALLQDDVSGQSNVDYLFFVNASAIDPAKDYIYLYAEMGFREDANAGEDRWAVDQSTSGFCASIGGINCAIVPEPTSACLFVLGCIMLGRFVRRR